MSREDSEDGRVTDCDRAHKQQDVILKEGVHRLLSDIAYGIMLVQLTRKNRLPYEYFASYLNTVPRLRQV